MDFMATYKIIGADQKEYGPVGVEQVRQWIRGNRANAQTLGQMEGETEWKPLGSFPEFAADLGAPPPPPAYAPPPPPPPPAASASVAVDPLAFTQTTLQQDYSLDILGCIQRSWRLVASNLALCIGATAIVGVLVVACDALPILGMIVSLVIVGPLTGGLYWLFLKLARGQEATMSNLFDGFQNSFVPLMLAQIVMSVLMSLSAMVFFFAMGLLIFVKDHSASSILFVLAAVGILPAIYLTVAWVFALLLIIDRQLGFWEAMELSRRKVNQHWWTMFGLMFMAALVAAAGLLACFVGVFFTLPCFIGSIVYAYEEIFRPPTAAGP